AADLRIGLIGLDTSHVTAFTKILNDPAQKDHVPGARVVAAFKGGSPDIASSRDRVEGYTKELVEKHGVKLYPTIEELCANVDAVMLESVDGRPHLWQAIPVIQAGKPLYIDKPMAGSLGDVIAIFKLAKAHDVPVFSSSSLRYGKNTQAVRGGSIGRVLSAETTSPFSVEPSHPDMFWYAVHGAESLFTVMGTGCQSVKRGTNNAGELVVTGTWSGGRTGTYRQAKGYGGTAKGEKGESEVGAYDGYAPLVAEAVKFFKTGVVPVPAEETIEMFAFMEAADESKRRGGEEVSLGEIYQRVGHQPPQSAAR
ncbi:MAG TPA: dehydrogenase, partial [Verrucomicrobiales bacterium]|nr:dehydrogenase [Verrucomicrobiales bacterium]